MTRVGEVDRVKLILLVEDHAAFRQALDFILNLQPGLRVTARCGSLAECRALAGRWAEVDVALIDLNLPDGDGAELIGELRGANPRLKVLILSASLEPGLGERMAALGADAVLNKTVGLAQIVARVRRLLNGGDDR
jgi:DNA-binding NarL/FixJ family response regulator